MPHAREGRFAIVTGLEVSSILIVNLRVPKARKVGGQRRVSLRSDEFLTIAETERGSLSLSCSPGARNSAGILNAPLPSRRDKLRKRQARAVTQ